MALVHLKNLSATPSVNPMEDTPLVMVSGTKILVEEDNTPLKQAMELGRKAGERLKQLFAKEE